MRSEGSPAQHVFARHPVREVARGRGRWHARRQRGVCGSTQHCERPPRAPAAVRAVACLRGVLKLQNKSSAKQTGDRACLWLRLRTSPVADVLRLKTAIRRAGRLHERANCLRCEAGQGRGYRGEIRRRRHPVQACSSSTHRGHAEANSQQRMVVGRRRRLTKQRRNGIRASSTQLALGPMFGSTESIGLRLAASKRRTRVLITICWVVCVGYAATKSSDVTFTLPPSLWSIW